MRGEGDENIKLIWLFGVIKSWNNNYLLQDVKCRVLTPIEYERLQTLEDNYTVSISKQQHW